MIWIKLGNPKPKDKFDYYELVSWKAVDYLDLPTPTTFLSSPLSDVLDHRRTIREFGSVPIECLSFILISIFRPQQTSPSPFGFDLIRKPLPSAGGIHPIHVLVNPSPSDKWYRYIPESHRLAGIDEKVLSSKEIRRELESVLQAHNGTVFLFVAEPGKTLAKYHHPTSLIWRDAGVILGYLGIVASALGLNFCPLGINGDQWASELDTQGRLAGVGMALLGSSSHSGSFF